MTVATYTRPDYTTQSGSTYPANIDGMAAVFERLAAGFAPHQLRSGSPAPDLVVAIDAGWLWDGASLTEIPAQTVSGFTVPSSGNERYDRVVIDAATGVASRVAGTAATGSPSPGAPDIPAGKIPCAKIRLTSSTPVITDSMIVDERVLLSSAPVVGAGFRQGIVACALDAFGQPALISAGAGLSVNIAATSTPLIVTAAGGYDSRGRSADRIGIQSADTSIGSLTNTATNFLYADIAASGAITFGATTTEPAYQWGGSYSVTSGQWTFNVQDMVGKLGDGAAAAQNYRVWIGEAVTSGGAVTSVVNYQPQGRYDSGWTDPLPGTTTQTSKNHNIGVPAEFAEFTLLLKCLQTDAGFAVGAIVQGVDTRTATAIQRIQMTADRNTVKFTTGGTNAFVAVNASTGANAALTITGSPPTWAYAVRGRRRF